MRKLMTGIFILVFSISALAHTNEEIENELVRRYNEIEKYTSYSAEYSDKRETKLGEANAEFRKRLLELTAQHSSTIAYSFPKLNEHIRMETSPDGRLRVFSWDTLTGGTMHMYDSVYQFRGVDGVFSRGTSNEEGEPGGFVTDIFDIDTKTGMVYLIVSTSVLSTSYNGQSVAAYQIDGNSLSDGVKIFRTDSGATDSIGFAYDFFSVVFASDERPIHLFHYDAKSKTLSFPVVIEDEKTPQGRVTSSRIVYRYDGEYFVRVKN